MADSELFKLLSASLAQQKAPEPSQEPVPVGRAMTFDNVKVDAADKGKLHPRYIASFVLRDSAGNITHIKNVRLQARDKESAEAEAAELPTVYWTGGTKPPLFARRAS